MTPRPSAELVGPALEDSTLGARLRTTRFRRLEPVPFPWENRLLCLLRRYGANPASLPEETALEVEENLQRLRMRIDAGERLDFSEARFVDPETVCVVFTGRRAGLCSLPNRASLLVDQDWNLSGGILFCGLRAIPVTIN